MEVLNIISQPAAISLTLIISILFAIIGIVYSKKYLGINNYLVANRNIGIFSLTSSFVASALEPGFYLVRHPQRPGVV